MERKTKNKTEKKKTKTTTRKQEFFKFGSNDYS